MADRDDVRMSRELLRQFAAMLAPVKRRLALAAGRAIINLVNDAGDIQLVQVDRQDDEVADDMERFAEYGFVSNPPPGAEAIVVSLGGVRSHGVAIACGHRLYRLKALARGEVALHDDLGSVVHLTRDGPLIRSPLAIRIESDDAINVNAPHLNFTGDMLLDGDLVVTGDVAVTGDVDIDGNLKADGTVDLGGAGGLFALRVDMTPATKVKVK